MQIRPPLSLLATALFLAVGSLLACGDPNPDPTFPARTINLPDLSQAGSLTGQCVFKGIPPVRKQLPVQDAWCGSVGEPTLSEDLIVDEQGGLAGVFIYVSSGLDAYTFPLVTDPFIIDQKNCAFVPHVAAVRVHQPVHFTNSDGTVHNINASASRENQGFVISMSPASDVRRRQFPSEEFRLPIRCDLHSAMVMYVHVVDHPYFAISREDGSFEIPHLPPGKYTLTAIHERCGKQSFDVQIAPGAKAIQTLRFADD